MPLHLLGKKSWNVYNKANIEIVRRDKAIAKAAEEAEEERIQALDAERRMQILRGETPVQISFDTSTSTSTSKHYSERPERYPRERKLRKKAGENDTDYEMRVARQKAEEAASAKDRSSLTISMIHNDISKHQKSKKNPETEREAAEKRREYEDQYIMRFSNAAGFKQSPGQQPWYSQTELRVSEDKDMVCTKDVWGNKDSNRLYRESKRTMSNDPLLVMKAGASRVREIERERKKLREKEKCRGNFEREGKKLHRRSIMHSRAHEDNDIETVSLGTSRIEHKKERKRDKMGSHRSTSRKL